MLQVSPVGINQGPGGILGQGKWLLRPGGWEPAAVPAAPTHAVGDPLGKAAATALSLSPQATGRSDL